MEQKDSEMKIEYAFQERYKVILDTLKIVFQRMHVGSRVLRHETNNSLDFVERRIRDIFSTCGITITFLHLIPFFIELEKTGFLHKIICEDGDSLYVTTLKNFVNIKTNTLFVAREFNLGNSFEFYKKLKQAILETKIFEDVIMLEEQGSAGSITEYMEKCIEECEFFIADLSSNKSDNIINPNVVYELGLAKGFGKTTFQIIDEKTHNKIKDQVLPFDIRNNNTITYSNDGKDWDKTIEDIIKVIRTTYRI